MLESQSPSRNRKTDNRTLLANSRGIGPLVRNSRGLSAPQQQADGTWAVLQLRWRFQEVLRNCPTLGVISGWGDLVKGWNPWGVLESSLLVGRCVEMAYVFVLAVREDSRLSSPSKILSMAGNNSFEASHNHFQMT